MLVCKWNTPFFWHFHVQFSRTCNKLKFISEHYYWAPCCHLCFNFQFSFVSIFNFLLPKEHSTFKFFTRRKMISLAFFDISISIEKCKLFRDQKYFRIKSKFPRLKDHSPLPFSESKKSFLREEQIEQYFDILLLYWGEKPFWVQTTSP